MLWVRIFESSIELKMHDFKFPNTGIRETEQPKDDETLGKDIATIIAEGTNLQVATLNR